MSNLCELCEHLPMEHDNFGRCHGDCLDPETGEFYVCVCPRFERDPDD